MKKIIYRKDSGEVSFFRRDIVAEKKAIQLLESSGLQRIGDIHFRLSAGSSEKHLLSGSISIGRCYNRLSTDRPYGKHSLLPGRDTYEQSCDDEVVDWFELHITVVVGNLPFLSHASASTSLKRKESFCYRTDA